MATPSPGAHRKRSLLQNQDRDIDDNHGTDTVNGNSNANPPPKRRCKSPIPNQTIVLDDDSPTVQNQARIVKNHSTKGVPHERQAGTNLLRTVLLGDRPRASQASPDRLCKFEFPESEINFIDIIGSGDHAIVFRITAGGRTFALKIHTYDPDAVSDPAYPKSNTFFDRESSAYTRLSNLQTETSPPIPKCYGYVNLTKPPQRQSRRPRHLFRSTLYRPAVYLRFINQKTKEETEEERSSDEVEEDPRWREYFRSKWRKCILRGLVFEEVTGRILCFKDVSNRLLAQSGQEALERIHTVGVLHGDVKNFLGNVLITKIPDKEKEERIVWINFSKAESSSDMDKRTFAKKVFVE